MPLVCLARINLRSSQAVSVTNDVNVCVESSALEPYKILSIPFPSNIHPICFCVTTSAALTRVDVPHTIHTLCKLNLLEVIRAIAVNSTSWSKALNPVVGVAIEKLPAALDPSVAPVANSNPVLFATIVPEQWSNVLVVVQDRLRWLYTQKGVTYVSIYGDHGDLAGNANPHPHLNLLTFSTIPPVIESEAESSHRISNEKGVCPMCQTVNEEISGPRQVLQTEGFIAFCPWAPSYPYEFWISPKKHTTSFSKITQKEINDLSLILRATLGGLSKTVKNVSYNLVFHLSPEKKNSRQIHWHIEVYPITKSWSGLERGYGIFLNDVSPEQAAEKLGASSRKELANLVGIV